MFLPQIYIFTILNSEKLKQNVNKNILGRLWSYGQVRANNLGGGGVGP